MVFDDDIYSFDIGTLDASNAIPLYQQLRDRLRRKLRQGWPSDRPIPSERQIMQMTGLSRMTVRQAIAELVHEGILRRDHGRGTFVTEERIVRPLAATSIFGEALHSMGRRPGSRVIRQELIPANPAVATMLHIEPGELVLDLLRVRLADNEPVMVAAVNIAARVCQDIATADLTGSLYRYLGEACGLRPEKSTSTIEAVSASAEVAALLEMEEGAPVLRIQRLTNSEDGMPLDLTDEFIRTDRCLCRVDNFTNYVSANLLDSLEQQSEARAE